MDDVNTKWGVENHCKVWQKGLRIGPSTLGNVAGLTTPAIARNEAALVDF